MLTNINANVISIEDNMLGDNYFIFQVNKLNKE